MEGISREEWHILYPDGIYDFDGFDQYQDELTQEEMFIDEILDIQNDIFDLWDDDQ